MAPNLLNLKFPDFFSYNLLKLMPKKVIKFGLKIFLTQNLSIFFTYVSGDYKDKNSIEKIYWEYLEKQNIEMHRAGALTWLSIPNLTF